MPDSLNTFLMSYPYKTKPYLRHICGNLNLDDDGLVEALRERILEHVGDDKQLDAKVRELGMKLKNPKKSQKDTTPVPNVTLSPTVHVLNGETTPKRQRVNNVDNQITDESSPSLFQTQSQNLEKSVLEEIDELEDSFDDELENEPIGAANSDKPLNENHTFDFCDDTNDADKMKKLFFLLKKSVEVIAIKDTQIEALEGNVASLISMNDDKSTQIKSLEESVVNLVSAHATVVEKHNNDLKDIHESITNATRQFIDHSNDVRSEVRQLKEANDRIEKKLTGHRNSQQSVRPANNSVNSPQTVQAITRAQKRLQQIASNSHAPRNVPPPQQTASNSEEVGPKIIPIGNKETVMVIGDSNTTNLKPSMLHSEKNVVLEHRYTLDQVNADMPQVDNPSKVTDIVVMTSFNDIRQRNTTVPETIKKLDETCQSVSAAYPNSAIHVGGVPPTDAKMIQFNEQVKNLVESREANFIPVKSMMDRNTDKIQSDIMKNGDRLHYSEKGVKIMAKEIKRSLYGYYKPRKTVHRNGSGMTNNQRTNDPRQTMANFLNMAMACLNTI